MKLTQSQLDKKSQIYSALHYAEQFHTHLDETETFRWDRGMDSKLSPLTEDLILAKQNFARLMEEIQDG